MITDDSYWCLSCDFGNSESLSNAKTNRVSNDIYNDNDNGCGDNDNDDNIDDNENDDATWLRGYVLHSGAYLTMAKPTFCIWHG